MSIEVLDLDTWDCSYAGKWVLELTALCLYDECVLVPVLDNIRCLTRSIVLDRDLVLAASWNCKRWWYCTVRDLEVRAGLDLGFRELHLCIRVVRNRKHK